MPGIFLLLAVVIPLLAFGGTATWGEPLAAAIAIASAAMVGVWAWRRKPHAPMRVPLTAAFLLAGLVAIAQAIPLPGSVAALLSPASHRVWTSAPFDDVAWHPLSLAPHASSGRAALLLGAGLLHLAAAWWIAAGRRHSLALAALAGCAIVTCALAVAERTFGPTVWLDGFAQPEQAYGPFPNRNDLGVLAAAAAPLAAAGLLGPLGRLARLARSSADGWGGALRSGPDTPLGVAWAGGLALLAGAVVASGSHSALFALAAGLVLFAGAAWFRQGASRWILPAAFAMVAAAAVVSGARGARGDATSAPPAIAGDFAVRRPLWMRVIAVAKEFPATGCGAGAMFAALPRHPDPANLGFAMRAENDLLETAAELGLPATLAILALAGVWLRRALRAARNEGSEGLAAAASVGAVAALATGAMGTFVVSVPALLLFGAAAAALGAPVAQGFAEARAVAEPGRRSRRLAGLLAAGVFALPLLGARGTAAWISQKNPDRAKLLLASRLDPASPAIALALARSYETEALVPPEPWIDAQEQIVAAERWYRRRLWSRPTDVFARLGLAALLETKARDPALTSDLATSHRRDADALSAVARVMDPGDPAVARYRIR